MKRLKFISKLLLTLVLLISTLSTGAFSMFNKTVLDFADSASAATIVTYTMQFNGYDRSKGTYVPFDVTVTINTDTKAVTTSPAEIAVGNTKLGVGVHGGRYVSNLQVALDAMDDLVDRGGQYADISFHPTYDDYMIHPVIGTFKKSESSSGGSCGGGATIVTYKLKVRDGYYSDSPTFDLSVSINTSTKLITTTPAGYYLGHDRGAIGARHGNYVSDMEELFNWFDRLVREGGYEGSVRGSGSNEKLSVVRDSLSKSESSSGGSCGEPTPAPAPIVTTVYPRTCAAGLTPKGSPGTASFYCEKPIKQTEYQTGGFIKDIDLSKIIGNLGGYGGTGDRGDGQFKDDSGTHSNGWLLDGSGNGKTNNFLNFTNIPDNSSVNAVGNKWSPEFHISQGKLQLPVPMKDDGSSLTQAKWDKDLNSFLATNSKVEVLTYEVTDLSVLETIQSKTGGLSNLFNRDSTGSSPEYPVKTLNVTNNIKVDLTDFSLDKSGYYILGTKYTDMVSAKAKHGTNPTAEQLKDFTFYNFTPISLSFMTDLGYLPIYNNLLSQVNENILLVGNKKANHSLANLKYETYKSMKIPSAYDDSTGKVLVASTNGGLQLLNSDLTVKPITNNTGLTDLNSVKVNNILSYGDVMYIASDKGVLLFDCSTNELTLTSITLEVNDINVYYDNLYLITDNDLIHYFISNNDLIESKRSFNLNSLFESSTSVGGRIDVVGGLLTVSSKDTGPGSEIIILGKL